MQLTKNLGVVLCPFIAQDILLLSYHFGGLQEDFLFSAPFLPLHHPQDQSLACLFSR